MRNQEDLEDYGITKAWDISELVEIGEKIQVQTGKSSLVDGCV